ncbi:nuclear transport factor 2 family protein [Streptomyces caniferus]
MDGPPRSGRGRGTNVLVNPAGTWQMLHEHLSASPGGAIDP